MCLYRKVKVDGRKFTSAAINFNDYSTRKDAPVERIKA